MNPNNITNVSFASSPALQALLNNPVNSPITPVGAPKQITTDSYLVQNPITGQAVSNAVLEKTPKTDVYEPIHKHDEQKNHKGAKKALALVSIGAIIAAIIFSPKIAKALLNNTDATQEVKKGAEFFSKENLKVAFKKASNFVEKQETAIKEKFQSSKFIQENVEKIKGAFKEDGIANKGITKVKNAFTKDGAINKFFTGLFSKKNV